MPSPSSSTVIRTPAVGQPSPSQRLERDAHGALAVADGVLDQVGDDLGELVGVGVDLGQVVGDLELDRRGRCRRRTRLDDPADAARAASQGRGCSWSRPVSMRATSRSSAISRLSRSASACDGGEHQLLLLVVEPVPAVEQRLHEALHAGQRRAQLVGDGGDQVGALAVEPGPAAAGAERDRDLGDRLVRAARRGGSARRPAPRCRRAAARTARGRRCGCAARRTGGCGSSPGRGRRGPGSASTSASGRPDALRRGRRRAAAGGRG